MDWCDDKFETPTELHCSQTEYPTLDDFHRFETPTELHCSQTEWPCCKAAAWFETPTELHCSQTWQLTTSRGLCLRPLQNYTALKLCHGS